MVTSCDFTMNNEAFPIHHKLVPHFHNEASTAECYQPSLSDTNNPGLTLYAVFFPSLMLRVTDCYCAMLVVFAATCCCGWLFCCLLPPSQLPSNLFIFFCIVHGSITCLSNHVFFSRIINCFLFSVPGTPVGSMMQSSFTVRLWHPLGEAAASSWVTIC